MARQANTARPAAIWLCLVVAGPAGQVAETLVPIVDTAGWLLKALVVLLAIGFVPALVFSWICELTPAGLKRDAEIDPALRA